MPPFMYWIYHLLEEQYKRKPKCPQPTKIRQQNSGLNHNLEGLNLNLNNLGYLCGFKNMDLV